MPAQKVKYFRCTKRSRCELANKRQNIEICDGKRSHACPLEDTECERANLRQIDPPGGKFPIKAAAIAAAFLVAGVAAFFFWASSSSPQSPVQNATSVEDALQEVWPWLK